MDFSLFTGALGSIQAAGEIVKNIGAIKTASEVNAKAAELTSIILSLQNDVGVAMAAQMELVQENLELKDQLAAVEDFRSDAKRYKLFEPWFGSLVYALKFTMSDGEPAHYLCASCYQSHKKSILQVTTMPPSGWAYFQCPACKSAVRTDSSGGGVPAQYAPE